VASISVSLREQDPPVGVVALEGEHDGFTARRIELELGSLLDKGINVAVDLSQTTFIDSETLSALLSGRHEAAEAELGFVLAIDEETTGIQVHRILEITGLASAFTIAPSLPAAIAAAASGAAVTALDALHPVE
jgi:anti-sigma B factor antagonist